MQGVKFYEPEVTGSSPEEVEYKGIQNLLNVAGPALSQGASIPIFDPEVPVRSLGAIKQVAGAPKTKQYCPAWINIMMCSCTNTLVLMTFQSPLP